LTLPHTPTPWRNIQTTPPDPHLVAEGRILVRRQWNRTPQTYPKPLYEHKALEAWMTVERAVSKGWTQYMEIPE
jgi:hypothetical protein